MSGSYGATADNRNESFPKLGEPTRALPIHVFGDSHSLGFRNVVVTDEVTGQTAATRVRFFSCTPDTFYSQQTGFAADLLSALEHEGLLRDGRPTHHSWDPADLRIGYSTGLCQLAPLILINCGDIELRSNFLRQFKDEWDFVLPEEDTYATADLPLVPYDVCVERMETQMSSLVRGISALRGYGYARTYLHCIVPPTTDDASFERVNGYRCPVNTRYKAAVLCNRFLANECRKRGIPFIDIWPDVTHNGYLRSEYELDGVHLAPSAVRFSLNQVIRLGAIEGAGLNFRRYELLYQLARGLPTNDDSGPKLTRRTTPMTVALPLRRRILSRCKGAVRRLVPADLWDRLRSVPLLSRVVATPPVEAPREPEFVPKIPVVAVAPTAPSWENAPTWFGQAVGTFHQIGLSQIPIEAKLFQKWRSMLDFNSDVGNRHISFEWIGNTIKPFNDTMRSADLPQVVLDDLVALLDGEAFNRYFEAVLGCKVMVMNTRAFMSTPHQDDGNGPQAFHTDGVPAGVLRGVLYLTDVTADAGPFQYKDPAGETQSVTAPAGTLLVFDANRLVHRGSPPRGTVRKVLDFVFGARLPGQPMLVIGSGMNNCPYDPFQYTLRGMKTSPLLVEDFVSLPPYDVASLLPLKCYRPRDQAAAA